MKPCIIIPTYNEAKTIAGIIKQIRAQNLDVVVIDDGSQDNTSLLAQENGAVVIKNTSNQGKGASLIRGFDYALNNNFDTVITMDGDGQHLPNEIPYFVGWAQNSGNYIFIGNRMTKTNNMPWIRAFTNQFMSWFISVIAKQRIPDTQCGFRLIKKEALKNIQLKTSRFETESEILIKASHKGYKIESLPIGTIYNKEKSQINPVLDTIRFVRFVFNILTDR